MGKAEHLPSKAQRDWKCDCQALCSTIVSLEGASGPCTLTKEGSHCHMFSTCEYDTFLIPCWALEIHPHKHIHVCVQAKRAKKPVRVWCDGCYDMMHFGHAVSQGSLLLVCRGPQPACVSQIFPLHSHHVFSTTKCLCSCSCPWPCCCCCDDSPSIVLRGLMVLSFVTDSPCFCSWGLAFVVDDICLFLL